MSIPGNGRRRPRAESGESEQGLPSMPKDTAPRCLECAAWLTTGEQSDHGVLCSTWRRFGTDPYCRSCWRIGTDDHGDSVHNSNCRVGRLMGRRRAGDWGGL